MTSTTDPHKLCIFCRELEPVLGPCPTLQFLDLSIFDSGRPLAHPSLLIPLSPSDTRLLRSLGAQDSTLCAALRATTAWKNAHALPFGNTDSPLSSLILVPSCPLCRLIYRIFPRPQKTEKGIVCFDPTDTQTILVPFRGYERNNGWEGSPPDAVKDWAVLFGVESRYERMDAMLWNEGPGFGGEATYSQTKMEGEAIALRPGKGFEGPKEYAAKVVPGMVDYKGARKAVDYCLQNHGKSCGVVRDEKLRTARMLDVIERKTVDCPENCDYAALSYVWGGVMPAEGALEKGTLPQTIKDAITATREIEVAALKQQQLEMMDLIYQCATVVIVALARNDSNAGLPGVSNPRALQIEEAVGGHMLFTVPPDIMLKRSECIWETRAWTFQEAMLGRRYLHFSDNQLQFSCLRHNISEGDDETSVPDTQLTKQDVGPLSRFTDLSDMTAKPTPEELAANAFLFMTFLREYTTRRLTYAGDSLNGFLSVVSVFQKRLFPGGFFWGLPMADYPRLLGWFHDRSVGYSPRRHDFPSWSWCGWEEQPSTPTD
ncbi:hypothetical protein QBC44DRAFT_395833 [Cladorrhinum sp. PSN332]|nr:hypothetical protein QBC44DRAFT_395833 [Cladorrhinum sp. PSN332]